MPGIADIIEEALGNTGGDDSGSATGSTTGSTTSSSTSTSAGPSEAEMRARLALIASYEEILRRWGIKANKNLMNLIERGVRSRWSSTQFVNMLRQTPEYRQQFRGITWRTGMTEGQYLSTYAQYKERAQDIGERLSRKEFAILLKKGKTFEEFSDQIDAAEMIDQYGPLWDQFRQALELRGINVPGKKLSKKELAKFIMGLGDKKWEQVWQEAYLTTQLEQVAGVQVVAPRAGEVSTPDSYELTRTMLLGIIKEAEALNPGFQVEKLTGEQVAALGEGLKGHSIEYMRRYGLTTSDYFRGAFGGRGATEIREKSKRILATQEAFVEGPRAVAQFGQQVQQGEQVEEELPQSL